MAWVPQRIGGGWMSMISPAALRSTSHVSLTIDRGGIERVDGLGEIDAEGFLGIQRSCQADQSLREARVDAPVARGIGVRQRVARDRATDPEVIELGRLRPQALRRLEELLRIAWRVREAAQSPANQTPAG